MGSVNKVILVGNLGRDAELRYTPGGAAVATLNMATTETWNDKDGNKRYTTEIKGDKIVLLGGGGGGGQRGGGMSRGGGEDQMGGGQPSSHASEMPDTPLTDDDIPF